MDCFINPLVGSTKSDDIPADVRMRCYRVLLEGYYPPGPRLPRHLPGRDALRWTSRGHLARDLAPETTGCTHFIVGRGPCRALADYYGTYDAQRIFEQFGRDELAIQPLKFDHALLLQDLRPDGLGQELPPQQRGSHLPIWHQGCAPSSPQARGPPPSSAAPRSSISSSRPIRWRDGDPEGYQ